MKTIAITLVSVGDSVVTVVNLLEIIIVINNMICSDTYVHCIVDDRLIEILVDNTVTLLSLVRCYTAW